MNDTLPLRMMCDACSQVLDASLTCLQYRELTRRALQVHGVKPEQVNWQRQIEDVREKILQAGQMDTFYIDGQHCIAGKRAWFSAQRTLFVPEDDSIVIPGHAQAGADGAFEALMRDPFMEIKTPGVGIETVKFARARGLVLEKHVSTWFFERWPDFYRPAANTGSWSQACNHDFRLIIAKHTYTVDVFGPDRHGKYAKPSRGKHAADMHLACRIVGQNVHFEKMYSGKDYIDATDEELSPNAAITPRRFIVWLNCLRDGLPYTDIVNHIRSLRT